jgi:hypothetical protein
MTSLPTSRLLALPAEIRLNIYAQIIASRPLATSRHLASKPHDYRGLILSCRQLHSEFTAEALEDAIRLYELIRFITPRIVRMPKLETLADTKNIFGLAMRRWYVSISQYEVRSWIEKRKI